MKKFIRENIDTLGKRIYFSYGVSIFIILFTLNTSASLFFYSWERDKSMDVILKIRSYMKKEVMLLSDLENQEQTKRLESRFSVKLLRDLSADLGEVSVKVWKNEKKVIRHEEGIQRFDHKNKLDEFQNESYKGESFLVYNTRFTKGWDVYYIQVIGSMKFVKTDLFNLFKSLLGANLLALILAYYSGSILKSSIVMPINEITKTTEKINKYALNKRITVHSDKDELGKLAIAINEMVERIEMSFKSQETFISNASHELRTPLTVIKGYADLLDAGAKIQPEIIDKAISEIKFETGQMNNLISTLLFIARKENLALKGETKNINLSNLLGRLIKNQELIDPKHSYVLNVEVGVLMGTIEDLFSMLIRELLKNAAKYTPEGKKIYLTLKELEESVVVIIQDEGIGMNQKTLESVFKRFYRSDEVRNRSAKSHGLGMSIVKNIVDFHKAKIDVESNTDQGTKVTISFPRKKPFEDLEESYS